MNRKTQTQSKRERIAALLAASTRRRNVLSGLAIAILIGGASGLVAQQPESPGPLLLNTASAQTLTIPVTSFRVEPFNNAIREALEQTTQRSATESLPSVVQRSALNVLPVTLFDRARFDDSITQSLSHLETLRDAGSTSSAVRLQTPHRSATLPIEQIPLEPAQAFSGSSKVHGSFVGTEFLPNAQVDDVSGGEISTGSELMPSSDRQRSADGMAYENAHGLSSSLTNQEPPSSTGSATHCATPNYFPGDFSPTPIDAASTYHDGQREAFVYDAKHDVPTQRPLIEWPRKWYTNGITPNGINMFGEKNLVRPKFYLYGDYRTGIIGGRNAAGRTDNWAHRLNLDLDLQITDTERFHMFMGPLDKNNQFTRFELVDGDVEFQEEIDFTPLTGFFEGDLGVLLGATHGKTSPFELPFTAGLVPLLFQNGIWMEDAVTGAAFALPARHSRLLNISNMDTTFFAAVDQINSPAFDGANAAQVFGTATFIEAYGGYIEAGYAYLNDRNNDDRDYHNATVSFTRRYFDRISNSVRVIVNAGQDGPKDARTADGALLLVENSWISAKPLTVVPYANFFVGWDRPQSVARAAASGGILRNTGINFDTDGLNGFATLDTSGSDSAGGAIGVDLIGDSLDKQLIVEAAYQAPHGSANPNLPDDQFAIGSRLQFNLTHATLLRFDVMHGWRRGLEDVYGTRMEYRWKF